MADSGLVVVVGAGIGGLAVAVALNKVWCGALLLANSRTQMICCFTRLKILRHFSGLQLLWQEKTNLCTQVGIPVTVLEKSDTLREEGASINLATNAWRAMAVLGIADTLRQRFCRIERYLPHWWPAGCRHCLR